MILWFPLNHYLNNNSSKYRRCCSPYRAVIAIYRQHLLLTRVHTINSSHLTFLLCTRKSFHPVSSACLSSILLRSRMLLDPKNVWRSILSSDSGSSVWKANTTLVVPCCENKEIRRGRHWYQTMHSTSILSFLGITHTLKVNLFHVSTFIALSLGSQVSNFL